jgi:2-(1,2-epoxy-1,2-dihydrophenyl)acetyl-CoA isomerase
MSRLALREKVSTTLILTLNRPQRHNSLIPEMLEALLDGIEEAASSPDVRAVVLAANGRSFSTGGDVRGFYDHRDDLEAYANRMLGLLNEAILRLLALPAPVIVAVQGMVTGGSLGLVLSSEVVLAAPRASFTPYYPVVGFSPDGGWTALLPALIGPRRAAQALLLNRAITAQQALEWGLVSRIVPEERLLDEALETARVMSTMKAGSLQRTKRLLNQGYGDLATRLEAERRHFVSQVATPEALEGMREFLKIGD